MQVMEETRPTGERGHGRGRALAITGVARILTAVLGVLFLAAALVYVFSARLVLTPTLTCQVSRPSLCRVWVNESPDPVIAAVLLVIAGILLIMAITGRGWVFSFGGASLAPAAEATATTPEEVPAHAVELYTPARSEAGARADIGTDARTDSGTDATRGAPGVTLFTGLPEDIRNASAAKWASWYPDSPIGTALQEVRRVPGQRDAAYFLRLRTPRDEDRWLRVTGTVTETETVAVTGSRRAR